MPWYHACMVRLRDTVTWWKSRQHYVCQRGGVTAKVPGSRLASYRGSTPKSLEVEPGNKASQDDVCFDYILDDVIAMDDVFMMSLGLYSGWN